MHFITYCSAVKSRCEIHKIPHRHGKRDIMQLVVLLTPIALLREWRASPLLFPHPVLAHPLGRTVKAANDVSPLAFPSGVKVEARVPILFGFLRSGPLMGVEMETDGAGCHPRRYLPR
jgi:hypothetical protein